MNCKQLVFIGLAILLIFVLAGCRPVVAPPNPQLDAADALRNVTFTGILPEQPVTLVDGIAEYKEDGGGTPFVQLVDTLAAAGDLDGDGTQDVVGLLVDYTTGSADFVYLAARLSTQGEPVDALLLGDRTPVKALRVTDDQAIVDFVGPGPSDAACCPTWNVRAVYAVKDGRLAERSRAQVSEVTLADLDGTAWRLVELGAESPPLLSGTEITLRMEDGQISGSTGCNEYNTALSSPEDVPQSLAVGPLAVTARLCDGSITGQESAYLDRLNKAVAWRYAFGRLAIPYKLEGDVSGELVFAP